MRRLQSLKQSCSQANRLSTHLLVSHEELERFFVRDFESMCDLLNEALLARIAAPSRTLNMVRVAPPAGLWPNDNRMTVPQFWIDAAIRRTGY